MERSQYAVGLFEDAVVALQAEDLPAAAALGGGHLRPGRDDRVVVAGLRALLRGVSDRSPEVRADRVLAMIDLHAMDGGRDSRKGSRSWGVLRGLGSGRGHALLTFGEPSC